jgi:Cu+-exporting ATPase
LKDTYQIKVLSGDNEGRNLLRKHFYPGTELIFDQKPEQSWKFYQAIVKNKEEMYDGGRWLNDVGALAKQCRNSISENVNVFSPACDGILEANEFKKLHYFKVV